MLGSGAIRIFISSPGDVEDERRRAAVVIRRLKREFQRFFELSAVLWELEPMLAHGHFQDIIEKPSETDIFVMILWSRLGTPLPADRYQGLDGRTPVTGAEWEFEEALLSRRRSGSPDLLVYRKIAPAEARFRSAEELVEAGRQWAALETFWERHFVEPDGGFKLAFNRFSVLDEFEAKLEAHLRERLGARVGAAAGRTVKWYQDSPFRGLRAFGREHASVFFGRAQAEREVVEALTARAAQGCAFLLVVGASGVGKSSLVQAGVAPTLAEPGVVDGVAVWRHLVFRPGGAEGELATRLAQGLARVFPALAEAGVTAAALAAHFRGAPEQAPALLQVGLTRLQSPADRGTARLILIIDQLEEVFTAVGDAERTGFATLLRAFARSGSVWVLATLRSDFFSRIAQLSVLDDLIGQGGQYHLLPPRVAEIGQIIREPAAAAGLAFERDDDGIGLDDVLQEAAARDPGALPLLEFVLDELYHLSAERGGDRVLTLASYRSLGSFEGAIAARADAVAAALDPVETTALSGVLLAMVTQAEDRTLTARPVARAEVATTPERERVLERLVAARLAVVSGPAVRLAHEALIARWPLLAELVEANTAFIEARRRLDEERLLWEREGRPDDLLLPPGKRLSEGSTLLDSRAGDVSAETAAFISASARHERRHRNSRRRVLALATALILILAFLAGNRALYGLERSLNAELNSEIAIHKSISELKNAEIGMEMLTGSVNAGIIDHAAAAKVFSTKDMEVDFEKLYHLDSVDDRLIVEHTINDILEQLGALDDSRDQVEICSLPDRVYPPSAVAGEGNATEVSLAHVFLATCGRILTTALATNGTGHVPDTACTTTVADLLKQDPTNTPDLLKDFCSRFKQ